MTRTLTDVIREQLNAISVDRTCLQFGDIRIDRDDDDRDAYRVSALMNVSLTGRLPASDAQLLRQLEQQQRAS